MYMLKNYNFSAVIKSSDMVTFMTLFNTSFHEKVKLRTTYHSKTPQDIKDNMFFFRTDLVSHNGNTCLVITASALGTGVNIPSI